jgi:SAM-dependent methyltransferase
MEREAESWRLDERAYAGRENLDARHARRYDAKEDAHASEEVRLLQDRGVLGPTTSVVDLGAGTGQFALAAAEVCRRVVAVDVSPVMLAPLAEKVAAGGFDNVEPAAAERRIDAWIEQTTSAGVEEGWTRSELAEHVRDEHSTFTWLLEPMIERAGFAIADATYSPDGIFARYLCTKRRP